MLKTVTYTKFIWAVIIFMICSAPVFSASAEENGYEGLIAPSSPAQENKEPDQPSGYSGVIPGHTEDSPETILQSQGTGTFNPVKPKTADDLKMLSAVLKGREKRKKPEVHLSDAHLSPEMERSLLGPRRDGMLPIEFTTKREIERLMPLVRDKTLSEAEREENFKMVYKKLSDNANAFSLMRSSAASFYKKKGFPDGYINGKVEDLDASIHRLDEALKELKNYR